MMRDRVDRIKLFPLAENSRTRGHRFRIGVEGT